MTTYLGVDAGNSKTYAVVTNEAGDILGKGQSGNGNHQNGKEAAERNILAAVNDALRSAGLAVSDIAHACFGLAGADREADFRILCPMIAAFGFSRFSIVCDTVIAMRAGTNRSYGVVVVCGTGTNCAGQNRSKETLQIGGFSYLLGDFGGGGQLAVEAFRAVIRAWDGREPATLLTDLILRELGYHSVAEMFNDFLDNNKWPPLKLAKCLFSAAMQGDETAGRILRQQGEELGKSAAAVIRGLRMEQDTFDVVLAGSILTRGEGEIVNRYIEAAVKTVAPRAFVKKLTVEPVVGAIWLAMEADDGPVITPVYEKMRRYAEFAQL